MSDFDKWYDDPSTLSHMHIVALKVGRPFAETVWNAAKAELDSVVQAATERMACGHVKADWLSQIHTALLGCKTNDCDCPVAYCRTCAEIQAARVPQGGDDSYVAWCRYVSVGEQTQIRLCDSDTPGAFKVYRAAAIDVSDLQAATATAMAQQREAMREHLEGIVQETIPPHLVNLSISLEVIRNLATEALNAPLADAPAQKWLEQMERHDRELRDKAFQAGTQATRGDIAQLKQEYTQQLAAARLDEAKWWNENVPLAAHVGCHDIIDDCGYCARIAKLEAELHQP